MFGKPTCTYKREILIISKHKTVGSDSNEIIIRLNHAKKKKKTYETYLPINKLEI